MAAGAVLSKVAGGVAVARGNSLHGKRGKTSRAAPPNGRSDPEGDGTGVALATCNSSSAAMAVAREAAPSLSGAAAGRSLVKALSLAGVVFCEGASIPGAVGGGGPAGEGAADGGALVVPAEREQGLPLSASGVDPVPRVLPGRTLIL